MSLAATLERPRPAPHPGRRPDPADPAAAGPRQRPVRRRAEPLPAVDEPLGALPEDEVPVFKALRRDWHARLFPIDAAEWALADAVACAAWRRRRLDALEDRVLRALLEGAPAVELPSLAQLARARARLERDLAAIDRELARLQALRPAVWPGLNPDRLEWLAAKLREGRIPPPPEERAELATGPERAPEVEPSAQLVLELRPPEPAAPPPAHAAPEAAPGSDATGRSAPSQAAPASATSEAEPAAAAAVHAAPEPTAPGALRPPRQTLERSAAPPRPSAGAPHMPPG